MAFEIEDSIKESLKKTSGVSEDDKGRIGERVVLIDVPTQARSSDPGQGGAVSVGPIWHACIAIRPTKHRIDDTDIEGWRMRF